MNTRPEVAVYAANSWVTQVSFLIGILEGIDAFQRQRLYHFAAARRGDDVPPPPNGPAYARFVLGGEASAVRDPSEKRAEQVMFANGVVNLIGGLSQAKAEESLSLSPQSVGRSAPSPEESPWLAAQWQKSYLETLGEIVASARRSLETIVRGGGPGTNVEGCALDLLGSQQIFLERFGEKLTQLAERRP